MTPRDRPDGEPAGSKRRRWGRGDRDEQDTPGSGEDEFGWLADLRNAKDERTEIGPRMPAGPAGGRK
ncbi:MAG: hypothetical protein ACRDT2_23340, partial [Natronosporangium sp.]